MLAISVPQFDTRKRVGRAKDYRASHDRTVTSRTSSSSPHTESFDNTSRTCAVPGATLWEQQPHRFSKSMEAYPRMLIGLSKSPAKASCE
jgi:hypothetical protein